MRKDFIVSFFFSLATMGCLQEKSMQIRTVHVKQISGDATPEMLDIFHSATAGKGLNITFEKGTYHFYPDKALEFYRHITNHDDVVTRCAFPIVGFENVSINGNGSEFIFHGLMLPFIVEDCKNVTLENFSIDWYTPFSSEGLVVAVDEAAKTFDLKFSDDYPYVIRNGKIYFQKEYLEHEMGQSYFYDPVIGGVAYNTTHYSNYGTNSSLRPAEAIHGKSAKDFDYPYEYSFMESRPEPRFIERECKYSFKQLSPGLVRVYGHTMKPPKVGFIYAMKGLRYANRLAPALHFQSTDGVNIRNVDILHAGGMGLIAEYSSDFTLDNMNVIPPEGRMVSALSDGAHFKVCSGKILIKNCRFANQLDDGIGVGGRYHWVSDVPGDNKLGLRIQHWTYHYHTLGLRVGKPGDTIAIMHTQGGQTYDKLTIKSVQYINHQYSIVTINEVLPEETNPGDWISNLAFNPEVVVSNCEFINNRARGFIFTGTSKPAIIENCTFQCDMQAAVLRPGSGKLVFRNNIIQDTPYGGNDAECIVITGTGSNDIEITGNTFNHYNNLIMKISGVDGCTVSDNLITNSGTYPLVDPERPAFTVSNSKNVAFVNNSYSGLAKEILEIGENCEDIKLR